MKTRISVPRKGVKDKYEPFSVLIPVYYKDNPSFLTDALQSIEDQTLVPTEIVIVKDGPVPREIDEVISCFIQHCSIDTSVVPLKENRGLGNALNEGLARCNNNVIARMDADDISMKERFEVQFGVLRAGEYDLVGSVVEEFSSENPRVSRLRKVPETHDDIVRFAKRRNPVNHPTVMFRKEAVEAAGGYKEIAGFEDYFLWARMLVNGSKFFNVQEPLLRFRTDKNTFRRRGGIAYLGREISFRKQLVEIGLISPWELVFDLFPRTLLRLAPNKLRRFVYARLLRSCSISLLSVLVF